MIKRNLLDVQRRIEAACHLASRPVDDVVLVAVTKGRPLEDVKILYDEGVRDFGESRWQEAESKLNSFDDDEIRWHFIGALQSNKARHVAQRFDVIHSITNPKQVEQISKGSCVIDVFVEVNVANDPQKVGIHVDRVDEIVETVVKCKLTRFRGLMTIGPRVIDPKDSAPAFEILRLENERLGGQWLSMGMSEDFDVAIMEGSTHVRVGSALFRGA